MTHSFFQMYSTIVIGKSVLPWYNTELQEGGAPVELFLTGLAAFAGGALISWVNYLLLRRLMGSKGETGLSLASPLRTLLSAAYLLALYLLGKHTGLNLYALLVGGVLGLTILLALFTRRLTRDPEGKGKE